MSRKDRFREEELRRHYVELSGEKTCGRGHALFAKHFCTSSSCVIPCAVIADGYGRAVGDWKPISGLTETPKGKGDGHGKGDWVLRTEELPEPVELGSSAARRKGHRVSPADEEISLAQGAQHSRSFNVR
jgi:hypothetical protein